MRGVPTVPPSRISRSRWIGGMNLYSIATQTGAVRPAARSSRSRQSALVVASGFSTRTGLSVASSVLSIPACRSFGAATR